MQTADELERWRGELELALQVTRSVSASALILALIVLPLFSLEWPWDGPCSISDFPNERTAL
jgi:hypothetical protein